MTIRDIHVTNWEAPGGPYWDKVKERHTEPLIEATMKLTLSWDEYHAMIAKARTPDNLTGGGASA